MVRGPVAGGDWFRCVSSHLRSPGASRRLSIGNLPDAAAVHRQVEEGATLGAQRRPAAFPRPVASCSGSPSRRPPIRRVPGTRSSAASTRPAAAAMAGPTSGGKATSPGNTNANARACSRPIRAEKRAEKRRRKGEKVSGPFSLIQKRVIQKRVLTPFLPPFSPPFDHRKLEL